MHFLLVSHLDLDHPHFKCSVAIGGSYLQLSIDGHRTTRWLPHSRGTHRMLQEDHERGNSFYQGSRAELTLWRSLPGGCMGVERDWYPAGRLHSSYGSWREGLLRTGWDVCATEGHGGDGRSAGKEDGAGRKGPCGLLRRDYGILVEKKIRGHSGGNDRQGLTAGGGTHWREDSGRERVVRRVWSGSDEATWGSGPCRKPEGALSVRAHPAPGFPLSREFVHCVLREFDSVHEVLSTEPTRNTQEPVWLFIRQRRGRKWP